MSIDLNTIFTLVMSLLIGLGSGALSSIIALKLVQNDITWLKELQKSLHKRVYALERELK